MADNPYAQYATNPYTVYGAPRQAPMQTPDQAVGQSLQNQHTQQEITSQPLQNANTQTNIAQGQTSIASQQQQMRLNRATTASGLYKDYTSDPTVKAYREVIPQVAQAMSSAPGGPGDISVIYAWAKAMDPTGSVREGDVQLGQSATGPLQQAQFLVSQYHLQDGGKLPPEVRVGLIEAMRNKARQLDHQYSAVHDHYVQTAKASGIDPSIIGPHEGQMYRPAEEAYITAHGGTPVDPAATPLQVAPSQTKQGFDLKADPRQTSLTPEQTDAYKAWWKAHPDPSSDQLSSFLHSMGVPGNVVNADAIIASAKKGRISTDVEIKPDISDVRGGGNIGEKLDAGIRGAADTASFGLADKIAAVGDTLTNPDSSLGQNLAREYAISDYDTQNHFPSRLAGQVGGGLAMPLGEMSSVPQIALKSGAAGAAYGAGSTRSLSDMPQNALLGGVSGAALGGAVGAAGRGVAALRGRGTADVPPLVDPATGELNQPMDAMRPAQRVQTMREYGMNNISPGMAGGRTARVLEQGLNNVPGSAGVMEDFNSAASKDLRRSMQGVAQQFGSSKTLSEGGAQLQSGAKEYITGQNAIISKAYAAIPVRDTQPALLTNTRQVLNELSSQFDSNPPLAEAMRSSKIDQYATALSAGDISWHDLKAFRSRIGEAIGERRFTDDSTTSDLRGLYGALSKDMEATASASGPGALKAFQRANGLYKEHQNLIEGALTRILGNDGKLSPEKAAAAVQSMTKGGKGTGDLRTLAQIKGATAKSGAWDEIASTLIHLGGQPANSEGRAFSPQTFVQWYSDMAEPARAMLFKPELRKSLDGFVSMTQQLGRVKGLTNTSNTTPTMIGSGIIAAGGLAAVSHPMALLGIAGGGAVNYGMAKLWTSPKFVSLITGYGRAMASGNQNAVRSQIGRLSKLAATSPELRIPIENMLKSIANDNAMVGVAASQPNSEEQ